MPNSPSVHGTFAWYDLMTPDPAASKKFYPAITGWSIEPFGDTGYDMWSFGGRPLGGIGPMTAEQRAQGIPPHWLGYVNVDDINAAANKVRSLGGKVMHGPEVIPEVGRFAFVEDPQGAVFGILQSDNPTPGYDGNATIGRFSWHELMTTDYRRAFDFYRQLFGWENIEEMDMGPDGTYLEYGRARKMYGGMFNRRAEHGGMPPFWTFYVNVPDASKAIAAIKKNGGSIEVGPMDVPGGSVVAVAKDPTGAFFAIHQSPSSKATTARTRSKPRKATASKPRRPAAKKPAKSKAKRVTSRAGARKSATRKAAKRGKPRARTTRKPRRRR